MIIKTVQDVSLFTAIASTRNNEAPLELSLTAEEWDTIKKALDKEQNKKKISPKKIDNYGGILYYIECPVCKEQIWSNKLGYCPNCGHGFAL